jgi:hypothetical protein
MGDLPSRPVVLFDDHVALLRKIDKSIDRLPGATPLANQKILVPPI